MASSYKKNLQDILDAERKAEEDLQKAYNDRYVYKLNYYILN